MISFSFSPFQFLPCNPSLNNDWLHECTYVRTLVCVNYWWCSFTHMHMCWGPTSGHWTNFVGAYLWKKLILFIFASMDCKYLWLHRHVKWCYYYTDVVLMLVFFRQSYCSVFMGIFSCYFSWSLSNSRCAWPKAFIIFHFPFLEFPSVTEAGLNCRCYK